MSYQLTNGNLILRGVLALGPLVAELDQSSWLDRADHLGGHRRGKSLIEQLLDFFQREGF